MTSPLARYFNASRAYLIGIQDYLQVSKLSTPIDDIEGIADALKEHDFLPENISVNRNSSKHQIEDLVERMVTEVDSRDRVLFYFAGHGIARESEKGPIGFLLPADCVRQDESSFVDMKWLIDQFSRLPCKHFLLILDCCFAGSVKWAENYRDLGYDRTKKIYREKFERFVSDRTKAWQVITSSSYDEVAIDRLLWLGSRDNDLIGVHSPFAAVLIEALKGKLNKSVVDFQDGIITTTRLYNYIDYRITELLVAGKVSTPQTPFYFPLKETTKGQFVFLLPQSAGTAIGNLPKREIKNPYKGLDPYKLSDKHLFFGRERAVQQLKLLLTTPSDNTDNKGSLPKIILVSGASGVGKSSLIMAGLIPELSSLYPDTIKLPPIRPGSIKNTENYLNIRRSEIDTINQPYLLFIDQFEELITQCGTVERSAFDIFMQLPMKDTRCTIIISVRSDFESQFLDNGIFQQAFKNKFVVPPLQRNEVRDIILQPAYQAVIQIEANDKDDKEAVKFIDRVIDEAMQSPGSLPLLSFALEEWYIKSVKENDSQWVLKEEHYNGIGGVNGVLNCIVGRFKESLVYESENTNLKRLLIRMVAVHDDSYARAKIYADELSFEPSEDNGRSPRQLLEELVNLRIVTTNKNSYNGYSINNRVYYELAHDSILTSWKQFWEWIIEDRNKLPIYQQLSADTREWKTAPTNKNALLWHDGPDLTIVRKDYEELPKTSSGWSRFKRSFTNTITLGKFPRIKENPKNGFTLDEKSFIYHSIRKINRAKSLNRLAISSIVLISIFFLALSYNYNRQSQKNTALFYASESDQYGEIEKLSLLLEAWKINPDTNILSKIGTFLDQYEFFSPVPLAHFSDNNTIDNISFSSDTTIAFTYRDKPAENWFFLGDSLSEHLTLPGDQVYLNQSDSDSSIEIISKKNNEIILTLKDRELIDYVLDGPYLAIISKKGHTYYLNYVINKHNQETKLATLSDNLLTPAFLSDRKHILYQVPGTTFITDLTGKLIETTGTQELYNTEYVYSNRGHDYKIESLLDMVNQSISLRVYDINLHKAIATTSFSEYPRSPTISVLPQTDSTLIVALGFGGNEGPSSGNGQNTLIVNWNILRNKTTRLFYADKLFSVLQGASKTNSIWLASSNENKVLSFGDSLVYTDTLKNATFSTVIGNPYYYSIRKTSKGFLTTVFDEKLNAVFKTEYSAQASQVSISPHNKYLCIRFIDGEIYLWRLSNYFKDASQNPDLKDEEAAYWLQIEPADFLISEKGDFIHIYGNVLSGSSGAIDIDYAQDPTYTKTPIEKSKFLNSSTYYAPYDISMLHGDALTQRIKQDSLVKHRYENLHSASDTTKNSVIHYPNSSLYFIDTKIVFAQAGVVRLLKEEETRVVTGRLFDQGRRLIYVLENGKVHIMWLPQYLRAFINQELKPTAPKSLKEKYSLK